MKKLFLAVLILLGSLQILVADAAHEIRIGFSAKAKQVEIDSREEYWIEEIPSGKKERLQGTSTFGSQNQKIVLQNAPKTFCDSVRIYSARQEIFLSLNGRKYRGSFILIARADDNVTVVNSLSLDDYLMGVIPKEVSSSWPMESLKAQAVISRTYALKNLSRHASEGYDLCNSVHCQVYGAMESEQEPTSRAVQETAATVLMYDGDLAETFFFSNCGGRTEEPSNTWNYAKNVPYLKSLRCKYCKSSKHYSWETFFSQEQIRDALAKSQKIGLPIRSIKIARKGKSGRASVIKIRSAGGSCQVSGNNFRLALGPDKLDSTLIQSIRKTRGGFLFKGNGWGHGIGLCQDGACGLANKNTSYEKILKFYYPKTKLVTIGRDGN